MNIIFLDVDGVLNSINKLIEIYQITHKSHSGYSYPFDEKCLKNLQLLVKETNSKLVITSTWRKDKEGIKKLLSVLKEYDLDKEVIGFTPILNGRREIEINAYLNASRNISNFIILDNDYDMGMFLPYLVKTDSQVGLTIENVEEGIKKINHSLSKKLII